MRLRRPDALTRVTLKLTKMWESFCDYLENEIQHHHRCTSLTRDRRRLLLKIIADYRGHEALPITPENVQFMTLVFNHLFMIQSQIHWETSFQLICERMAGAAPASIFPPPNHNGQGLSLDPLLFPFSGSRASASVPPSAHNPDHPAGGNLFSGIATPVPPPFSREPGSDLFIRPHLSQDRLWDDSVREEEEALEVQDFDAVFHLDEHGHPIPDAKSRSA